MELIAAYLYDNPPIQLTNIYGPITFGNLKSCGWFEDQRQPKGFRILQKRISESANNDALAYRVGLRFRHDHDEYFNLDTPIPFFIISSERFVVQKPYGEEIRYKDKQVWHANEMKTTSGFIENGIDSAIIETIMNDVSNCLYY